MPPIWFSRLFFIAVRGRVDDERVLECLSDPFDEAPPSDFAPAGRAVVGLASVAGLIEHEAASEAHRVASVALELAALAEFRDAADAARAEVRRFLAHDVPAGELTPAHTRYRPILHFTERDIWDATLHFGIPYCPLYEKGYRSLGAKTTSTKSSDLPAWEQDLENTVERAGRRQDKEQAMERLRKLGYM